MITQCVEAECEILGTCPVYFCAYMFDTAAPFSTIFFLVQAWLNHVGARTCI